MINHHFIAYSGKHFSAYFKRPAEICLFSIPVRTCQHMFKPETTVMAGYFPSASLKGIEHNGMRFPCSACILHLNILRNFRGGLNSRSVQQIVPASFSILAATGSFAAALLAHGSYRGCLPKGPLICV